MAVPLQPGVGPATQVTPGVPSSSTQSNLGQMIGEIQSWNPDCSAADAQVWINNAYRTVIDKRMWTGLMVRGQITVPNVYSTGSVTVNYGSPVVTGVGTTFSPTMVGYQFRIGFTTGFSNIISVQSATQLTLDLPWGNQTQNGGSFQILNNIVQFGYNVKRVLECLNQRQGYRCYTGIPQAVLNQYDAWRTGMGWTFFVSPREFDPITGAQFFELYPAPTFQQTFPFLAYVQPPDLTDDAQKPYPFIRTDILVKLAISQALIIKGPKQNRYYDPQSAAWKLREAQYDLENMEKMDDSHYPTDLQWDYHQAPFSTHGSQWLQNHSGEDSAWGL